MKRLESSEIPEKVYCLICENQKGYNLLHMHLVHQHDNMSHAEYRELFDLDPNTPLHSQEFSEGRQVVALTAQNMSMIESQAKRSYTSRQMIVDKLAEQGIFTKKAAMELIGMLSGTIEVALQEGRLPFRVDLCLINPFKPNKDGGCSKVINSNPRLISLEDLVRFKRNFARVTKDSHSHPRKK